MRPALSFLARDFDNRVKSGKTSVEVREVEDVMTNKHKIDIATTRAALALASPNMGCSPSSPSIRGARRSRPTRRVAAPHF
mgnify:CR=1 FL=1